MEKENKLRVLKIMQIIKDMVQKQIKIGKDKRINMQKEGQIGGKL